MSSPDIPLGVVTPTRPPRPIPNLQEPQREPLVDPMDPGVVVSTQSTIIHNPPVVVEPSRVEVLHPQLPSSPLASLILLCGGVVLWLAMTVVLGLVVVMAVLMKVHPTLVWIVFGTIVLPVLVTAVVCVQAWRRARKHREYKFFLGHLAEAQKSHLPQSQHRELQRQFENQLEGWIRDGVLDADARRRVRAALEKDYPGGKWVVEVAKRALTQPDSAVQDLLVREAQFVAMNAALSPVGPISTGILIWRYMRLIRTIAAIYGLRPGVIGICHMMHRVARRITETEWTPESIGLLSAVYGIHLDPTKAK